MYRGSAIAVGVLFAGLGLLVLSSEAAEQTTKMITLTDGRNFNNFDQVGNANWRIAERSLAADQGNGYLVTKESYGDFKLRAEFWADEDTNSGVFIRCENPQNPNAQSCYEVNIFENNPNHGNATGAIVNVTKVDLVQQTANKWNVIEVEAKGPQLNVSVNGERTASVQDTKHARGRIALQYAAGVVLWRKVEIQPLSAADIAEEAGALYANCQSGFAIIFPGQPMARDVRYTTASGINLPAREFYVEKGGNRYSVTVADFSTGPKSDTQIVAQALAELSKKGDVRYRAYGELGLGKSGGQLNIFEANNRQLRASAYMAYHKLYITQADAVVGDSAALQFEQSITLINSVGNDLDRVGAGTEETRKFDCQ